MFENVTAAGLNSSSGNRDDTKPATVYLVLGIVFMVVVTLFGLTGNTLVLRVYLMKTRKTSTHILIMGLAIADLMASMSLIGFTAETALILAGDYVSEKWHLLTALSNTWVGVSVGITAFIAVDRYDCVCRLQKRWFSCRRAKIAILFVVLPSAAAEAPNIVCAVWSCKVTNVATFVIQATGFITALLVICVCYSKVYMMIRHHTRVGSAHLARWAACSPHTNATASSQFGMTEVVRRPQTNLTWTGMGSLDTPACRMPSACSPLKPDPLPTMCKTVSGECSTQGAGTNHRLLTNTILQRRTTRMLFATSVVFLIMWMPSWISIAITYNRTFEDENLSYILSNLLLMTYFVNNAVNPLIYGVANRQFRKDCKRELNRLSNICLC